MRKVLLCFLSAALLAVPAAAQTTGVPGINDCVINGFGSGATSPFSNIGINTSNAFLDFQVSAAPGDTLVGIAAGSAAVGSLPLGTDTVDIDLATLSIWLDPAAPISAGGFPVTTTVPASGTWRLLAPVSLGSGAAYAIQFAILGPALPMGLGCTQAHAGTVSSAILTSYTLGDDASTSHTLTANNINFYGQSYTSLNIGSNGQITFAIGSADFSNTSAEFFAGWQPSPTPAGLANPGVASFWTDANPGGTTSGATYDVIEDTAAGTVTVLFANQLYWGSGEPMGNHSVTFDGFANSVTFNFSGLLASTTNGATAHVGISNGDDQLGTSSDLTDGLGTGISTVIGSYASPGPDDSFCEEFPADTVPPFTTLTAIDAGVGTWIF